RCDPSSRRRSTTPRQAPSCWESWASRDRARTPARASARTATPPARTRAEPSRVFSLLLRRVRRATRAQLRGNRVVPLVARVLEHLVLGIAVHRERDLPRLRIHARIVDRHLVLDRVGARRREALDDVELLALRDAADAAGCGARRDRSLVVVIRRLHDERVAFPMPARI